MKGDTRIAIKVIKPIKIAYSKTMINEFSKLDMKVFAWFVPIPLLINVVLKEPINKRMDTITIPKIRNTTAPVIKPILSISYSINFISI